MSQEIATRTPQQELVASVRSPEFQQQVALALPEAMKPERFVRVMVTALLDNPDLADADPNSVFQAGIRCATDGLLPDGREAAFVKFNDKKKGPVCVYLSMIGGLRKIAAEFGWSIQTRVVYENDTFDHELGVDEKIIHHPTRPGLERGPLVAAYAIGRHRDHPVEIEVMSKAEIEKVRATSRAKDYGPWVDWYERMAEKTVGKRLFAKLPLAEADRERRDLLLASEEIPPERATEALYGPETPRAAEGPHQDSPPDEEGGEAAEEPTDIEAQSSSGAAPDGEAETSAAQPAEFAAPEGVDASHPDVVAANEAAELKFESGKYSGRTLREISEDGDDGASYLAWVLRNWKTERFRLQVLAFSKVYVPDAYEKATAE